MKSNIRVSGLRIIIAVLLLVALLSNGARGSVAAEQADSKQTEITLTAVQLQEELIVTIHGKHLTDVYAYELQLNFDPLRLQLIRARTEISGFTAEPISKGEHLTFAHTKVGSSAGMNGETKLAEFTFERIRGGNTTITLNEAKLVDSSLKLESLAIGKQFILEDKQNQLQMRDITGHWAQERIATAVELGFVAGYGDGTFRPNNPITRSEFSTLLTKALQLPAAKEMSFADKQEIAPWSRDGVAAAVQAGLIKGYEDGTFRGNQHINRAELTVIMVRGLEIMPRSGDMPRFADREQIPKWAQPAVKLAVDQGLLEGRGGNRFVPLAQATRAEAVSLILNLLYKKVDLKM